MRIAVLLYQTGSPVYSGNVWPFLFRLFSDPAIIPLSTPLRQIVAVGLASLRVKALWGLYRRLSCGSPLLATTEDQTRALESALRHLGDVRCFTAMRYSMPGIGDAWNKVHQFRPDIIVQLPLFPQYSRIITGSCLSFARKRKEPGDHIVTIRSHADNSGFITALVQLTRDVYAKAEKFGKPMVLFSAQGLPQKIIDQGDPYVSHCKKTVAALQQELNLSEEDSVLCFQGCFGPMVWTTPSTSEEIEKAAKLKRPTVVVPISFVADGVETLVDLAQDGYQKATIVGMPFFACVPAVGKSSAYIRGLAKLVRHAVKKDEEA